MNPKQIKNWAIHSHRSGWATGKFLVGPFVILRPVVYVVATPFIGAVLSIFLVVEPSAFDHEDHF